MTADGMQRPLVVLRAKALADGYTDGEIRRLIARGRWTKAVRGAYFVAGGNTEGMGVPMTAVQRHLVAMHAVRSRFAGDQIFSHVSAAVIHQLPVPVTAAGAVHVTRNPPARAHRGPLIHAHAAALAEGDMVERNGWRVTSVDRTVADLTRVLPFEDGVVVADAALHRQLTTKAQLAEQLKVAGRMPGGLAASRAIGFADGLSESVGESRSRVMIHRAGLPEPELQVEVRAADGRFLARGDFGYRQHRVLGEFDGKVEYGPAIAGSDPAEALFREELREDAVRDAGWAVVRWVWADLDHPAAVIERLQRALRRQQP
ncbi:hypothetical protein ACVBEQ_21360 [Nakamurella sp. GG22]